MQKKWRCHECNGIAEQRSGSHTLTSRKQQQRGAQLLTAQQHGAQLLKAEQNVGGRERRPLVGANRAADNTVSGIQKLLSMTVDYQRREVKQQHSLKSSS